MADENRDDIVTKPDQDTPTPVDTPTPNKSDGATTPTTDQQNTNTKPDNEAPSGNPLDPRNSALGDSVWLGMDDAELEAEAARRLEADEEEAPDFKNSLSGLDGKDTPANKGANTSVLDRLNAANNKPKEEADAKPKEEVKGANTAVLDRLNDSQNKAKAEVKDEFNIDDILAAAKSNTAKINELKSQAPAGPSETDGRNQNQSQSNKQDAKPTSENEADAKPDDDEEEYEYDADGNRIVRGARINTGLGGGSTKSNATPKSKPANQTQAKNTSANQKSSAATPAATAPKQSTSTAQNNPATPTPPKPSTPTPQGQNNNQPTTQPQNASNKPGAPSQGGNAPAGGGGGGGGSVPLKQNIGALVSNTVGLAKNTVGLASNTVGVAASAVGSIPAFANAIKTNTGNAVNKLTGNAPGNTSATANTATANTANTATGKTPRAPIPTSNMPNVKTGAPFTNHAANQSSYSMNGLRPANTSKPTNNLAPGQKLNLKHPLPPHQNLTPIKNNVIPISAAQNKTARITPAAAIASNSTAKPTSKAAGGQLLQKIAQKSKQKKQGLFANLPADNAMHNLPPTTKQALEDAHSARNSINDNLGSIEKDNPIGTLRDQKEKGLNDGFRNYADSSEAANELLKNNSKKPADREASLEATKYLDKMNKDVSKNTDTAKGKKLLDKDNDANMQDKMKGIVESTKKIMDSIKATIESVAKLFSRNKPKP